MSKIKKLLQNISIFGISQFSSKVLVFLLLPLYTEHLSTSEFGDSDLTFSLVSLLLPLFTMEISSAVLRFTIEKKSACGQFFQNSVVITLLGFALLLLAYPLFHFLDLFDGYLYLFYLLYISNAFYNLLSQYARGLEQIKIVGICGVLNTAIIVCCNILFLVVLGWGIHGYLLSYIIGYVMTIVTYCILLRRFIPPLRVSFSKKSYQNMLRYSVPLMPNNIAWWGVSSANKFIIRSHMNESVLGLYSASLRIPSVITTIQSIISEGLVLSVLDQYNEKEPDSNYYSFLYNLYSAFSIFVALAIIVCSKFVSSILFSEEFAAAASFVPLLCISPIWGALSGFLGTFYSASKKTKGMFISTVLGAAISILISFLGIYKIGVYAVIFGNIITYFTIWLYRWIDVKKVVTLKVNMINDIICWLLLIGLAVAVTVISNFKILLITEIAIAIIVLLLNGKFFYQVYQMLKKKKASESEQKKCK